jgi:hypothetical protein
MFNQLLARWRFRKTPRADLVNDYETLIRLARRCAYDLRHTADELPLDHYFITTFEMRQRAGYWVTLFSKGNPGKDYRLQLQHEVDGLACQLDELHAWCADQGLTPPDRRDPFR